MAGNTVLRPVLLAALLCALPFIGPAAHQLCGATAVTADDATDPGFMPTFKSGDALPVGGVFNLVLQPATDVIYPARFKHAGEGGYGGIITIVNVPAGRYRIVFSRGARVDAVQRYALLPSQVGASEAGCSGSDHAIEIAAQGGPLTLQVIGAHTPLISFAVIRLSLAAVDVRDDSDAYWLYEQKGP